ncbi:MAG TPA: hypothetical protein GXX54_04720 [Clostridiales bacterium]|nr:hypothetical protein [Clostridiales bacterium]
MNKKPFWKRVNRGFVFSMVLLAAVIFYVTAEQVMLIPERQEIRELADKYISMCEQVYRLSKEQISELESQSPEFEKETKRLKDELANYFVKDSGYLDDSVEPILSLIRMQVTGDEQVTRINGVKKRNETITIDQDVAKFSATYNYTLSGKFYDYRTDKVADVENATKDFFLRISFKKVDGNWKIYRISDASWSSVFFDR